MSEICPQRNLKHVGGFLRGWTFERSFPHGFGECVELHGLPKACMVSTQHSGYMQGEGSVVEDHCQTRRLVTRT